MRDPSPMRPDRRAKTGPEGCPAQEATGFGRVCGQRPDLGAVPADEACSAGVSPVLFQTQQAGNKRSTPAPTAPPAAPSRGLDHRPEESGGCFAPPASEATASIVVGPGCGRAGAHMGSPSVVSRRVINKGTVVRPVVEVHVG
mmetsp:Transcript_33720/g.87611  ORF Transcript_33720/g.87611 Transcript_33720/m.87611 type:complete len:143 (+) Transcript_33720:1578-2006(+)